MSEFGGSAAAVPHATSFRLKGALRRRAPLAIAISASPCDTPIGPPFPVETRTASGWAPARRLEFLAGRACARQALAELGVAPTALAVGPGRAPDWPPGVIGSISHSGGVAAAVAARTYAWSALGFDFETACCLPDGLDKVVASRGELRLCGVDGGDPGTLAFSIKEAVFKAHWPWRRSFLAFEDVVVEQLDATAGSFVARARSRADGEAVSWCGRCGRMEGLVFALAMRAAAQPGAAKGTSFGR